MDQLSESNFLVYAMNNFESPTCLDLEEFNEEIKRFRYITRAFKADNINTQLILNHIIILYNMFGQATTNMLLFKIGTEHMHYLLPFLLYLDRLSMEQIAHIALTTVPNEVVMAELRNL